MKPTTDNESAPSNISTLPPRRNLALHQKDQLTIDGADYIVVRTWERYGWATEQWFDVTGQWHRIGGPAITLHGGAAGWYRHGKSHRIDGPATTTTQNPDCGRFFLYDRELTRDQWEPAVDLLDRNTPWEWVGAYIQPAGSQAMEPIAGPTP